MDEPVAGKGCFGQTEFHGDAVGIIEDVFLDAGFAVGFWVAGGDGLVFEFQYGIQSSFLKPGEAVKEVCPVPGAGCVRRRG